MLLSSSLCRSRCVACSSSSQDGTAGLRSFVKVIASSSNRGCVRSLASRHVSCMPVQLPTGRAVSAAAGATGVQSDSASDQDRQYMQHALKLARKGLGKTYPNPAVGCVIVKDSKVIGEGYHPKAGEPHAEVFALRAAGQEAEGSTAYVTLEPCNHYGKTPPCSQALVDAKAAKVFVGVRDPNPLVNNAGMDTLLRAGIEVVQIGGQEEQDCFEINADFMARMAPQ